MTSLPSIQHEIDNELDSLDNRQLEELLGSLQQSIDDMTVENQMFERHYNRVNTHALGESKMGRGGDGFEASQFQGDGGEDTNDSSKVSSKMQSFQFNRKKKNEKKLMLEGPMSLNIDQKIDVLNREIEEMREVLTLQGEDWMKISDNFKAELECYELTLTDLKKDVAEFKRDVAVGGIELRTGKVTAEKLLRYYDEKIRAKDTFIEKIRLKNASLRNQKYKLHQQLKQKEEMGEVLHAIDYDQLQIENSQYLVKIEEKNIELSSLKFKTGNILQKLNMYKKKLDVILKQTESHKRDIAQRKELIHKLLSEGERVVNEKKKEQLNFLNLKQQIEDFKIPEVMEYVHLQAEQRDLEQKINVLTRKIEIHGHELARSKMRLKRSAKEAATKRKSISKGKVLSCRSRPEKLVLPPLH